MHLLLEILADTVFFAPSLIVSRLPLTKKVRVLAAYARLTVNLLFINSITRRTRARFLGFTVHCFEYRVVHLLFRTMFLRNEYFFRSDNPHPVILDCGANVGMAVVFFKWLYPECEVHAFEPDAATFTLLKRNVEENGFTNTHLYNVALSDVQGGVDFFIDNNRPGALRMSLSHDRMPKDRIRVEATMLSSFIRTTLKGRQVDFMKLDVEGNEEAVLLDLSKTGTFQNINCAFIEYHHKIANDKSRLSRFLQLVEENGFEYQIETYFLRRDAEDKFQNILIHAYKEPETTLLSK